MPPPPGATTWTTPWARLLPPEPLPATRPTCHRSAPALFPSNPNHPRRRSPAGATPKRVMPAGAAAAAFFILGAVMAAPALGQEAASAPETAPALEAALPGMPVLPPLPLPRSFRSEPVPIARAPEDWMRFRDRLLAVAADHPRRAVADARIEAARGRLGETRAGQYPSVDIGLDTSRRLADNGIDSLDSRIRGSDDRSDVVLTARQLLYDGGATFDRIDGARARLSAARNEDEDEAALLIRDAVIAHLDVLEARTRLDLARAEADAYRALEARIAERLDLGGGTRGDGLRIAARLSEALATEAAQSRALDTAAEAYLELYGEEPPAGLMLPPRPEAPREVQEAIDLIDTASPALAARREAERAARFDVDAADAEDWPELSLQLQSRRYDVFDDGRESDLVGRIVVSLPLYDGGARDGRQAQARAAMRAAEADTARIRRMLARDVSAAVAVRAARDTELGALLRALDANEHARAIFRDEFEAGMRDLLDLIEVERDYHLAAARLVSGRIEAERAHWRLLEASGALGEATGPLSLARQGEDE